MTPPRARALGIPFAGTPGPLDAITDVPGVEVGHVTLTDGGARTGVTAIWPRGRRRWQPVFAATATANGNGELTGAAWIAESGVLEGPIALTGTYAVGTVHDAMLRYLVAHRGELGVPAASMGYGALPVVGETWDGDLSRIEDFPVAREHVFAALDGARGGPVAEGSVGGGTGMMLFDWKGGTGTASRLAGGGTIGVLAQCNFGSRPQLVVGGVRVGAALPLAPGDFARRAPTRGDGSVVVVIATDLPLPPHQLVRLARRGTHGIARVGAVSEHGSGDMFLACSTAEPGAVALDWQPPAAIDELFEAVAEATEEAVINALVAAEDMVGHDGVLCRAIDTAALRRVLGVAS